MPIEDADRVHSRGNENTIFSIFGFKITMMKLLLIVGGGIGGIFLIAAAVLMMTPTPIDVNIAPTLTPIPVPPTNMSFEIIQNKYNYSIVQITYDGTQLIRDLRTELLLSVDPPQSNQYVKRQSIVIENVTMVNNSNLNKLYVYTGTDNAFHISYIIPKYEDCVDFIEGDWVLNVDNGKTHTNLYQFKYSIISSKTQIIDSNTMRINDVITNTPDYSTIFIYYNIYKERLNITKPLRIIGMNNPIIDAGGYGSGIIAHSSNNTISGLIILNSGIKHLYDGGIVLLNSNSNTINNNKIYSNDNSGITLVSSSLNSITNNILYNNLYGIYADSQSDVNTIRENTLYSNTQYGIIIDNYNNLNNICEYNNYNIDKMSCSNSINRDVTPIRTSQPQITSTNSVTTEETNWNNCQGNPKCYQS
jgi:parallel beta-helix repeat protein